MTVTDTELERVRQALAASGDLAYEWDLASDRIAWFHDASERHDHAFITEATAGAEFNALVYPEDLPYRLEAISNLRKGATEFESEFRLRRGDDMPRWFHDRGVAVLELAHHPFHLAPVLGTRAAQSAPSSRPSRSPNQETSSEGVTMSGSSTIPP